MAMGVPKYFSATLQRILLWGVPSLALLGLVGAAGVRLWFNRNTKKTRAVSSSSSSVPAANSEQVSSLPSCPPVLQRRSSAPCSGEEDRCNSPHGPSNPRKNSQETYQDRFATPFKLQSSVRGKQLTSSNLQLPPMESETPLKTSDLVATESHIPAIQGESFSDESTSSSEGPSLPCKSSADLASGPPAGSQTEPSSGRASASESASNATNGDKSNTSSKGPPLECRKDRVRVILQIPRGVVGRFIGKQGRNIKALMLGSNGAHVYVNQKNLPKDAQIVMCTVQGTSVQIKDAMNIITAKYPEIPIPPYVNAIGGDEGPLNHASPIPSPQFGNSGQNGGSWEVELLPATIPVSSFSAMACYLETLVEVWLVACERSVELDEQHQHMSYCYCYTAGDGDNRVKEGDDSLLGRYCAVRVSEIHWLRGRITQFGDDGGSYEVQLMDYGSIVIVPPSAIKPLRREHSRLPVQAFKVKLAHVESKEGSTEPGLVSLQKLVEGVALEVHITGRLPCEPFLCGAARERFTGGSNPDRLSPASPVTESTTTKASPSNRTLPSKTFASHPSSPEHCGTATTTPTVAQSNSSPVELSAQSGEANVQGLALTVTQSPGAPGPVESRSPGTPGPSPTPTGAQSPGVPGPRPVPTDAQSPGTTGVPTGAQSPSAPGPNPVPTGAQSPGAPGPSPAPTGAESPSAPGPSPAPTGAQSPGAPGPNLVPTGAQSPNAPGASDPNPVPTGAQSPGAPGPNPVPTGAQSPNAPGPNPVPTGAQSPVAPGPNPVPTGAQSPNTPGPNPVPTGAQSPGAPGPNPVPTGAQSPNAPGPNPVPTGAQSPGTSGPALASAPGLGPALASAPGLGPALASVPGPGPALASVPGPALTSVENPDPSGTQSPGPGAAPTNAQSSSASVEPCAQSPSPSLNTSAPTSARSPSTPCHIKPSAQSPPSSMESQQNSTSAMELSPLALYIPLVELYTQVGAQTPTFINRELVELGFASWKEEPIKSSPDF